MTTNQAVSLVYVMTSDPISESSVSRNRNGFLRLLPRRESSPGGAALVQARVLTPNRLHARHAACRALIHASLRCDLLKPRALHDSALRICSSRSWSALVSLRRG